MPVARNRSPMRLYVTGLPADATPTELASLFAPFGAAAASTIWVVTVGRVGVVTLPGVSGPVPGLGGLEFHGRALGVWASAPWEQAGRRGLVWPR